ncbi:MAG: hypothetical protein WAK03_03505 [Methylocystis sp.]
MHKSILAAAMALPIFLSIPAFASDCDEDSISTVSDDGEILVMLSGQVYRVDAGDTADTALWLPTEDVLICGLGSVEIINKDSQGEKVSAVRLK